MPSTIINEEMLVFERHNATITVLMYVAALKCVRMKLQHRYIDVI